MSLTTALAFGLIVIVSLSNPYALQYVIAGWLLLLGVVLFFVTVLINKHLGISPSRRRDMEHLENATPDDD